MDVTPLPGTTPGARAEESRQPLPSEWEPVGRCVTTDLSDEFEKLDTGASPTSPYRQLLPKSRMASTERVNRLADLDATLDAVVVLSGACVAAACRVAIDPRPLTAGVAGSLPVATHLNGRRNLASEASPCPDDGVIVTRSWMELVDIVELLQCQPRPTGPRTAVFSTSPEASSAATAALDDANLLPAEVTQHTEMRTRLVVSAATHTGWLVTVPPTSGIAQMALALATLAEDPGVDAIVSTADAPTPEARRQVAAMLDRLSTDHPEVTLVSAVPLVPRRPDAGNRVPALPGVARAMRAVANARLA